MKFHTQLIHVREDLPHILKQKAEQGFAVYLLQEIPAGYWVITFVES